ncbi:MAG: hypothetical protein A2Y23_03210 [Clostridiales bacterium GWB2_37_7]|nr:MAG: hypothetical protein A2Y23_03210 [Clostridiales bacterium GWB2_37_7]
MNFNMNEEKLAYILKSLRMCRNDYYRKLKKQADRELLILDKPIEYDEDILVIDTLVSDKNSNDCETDSLEEITSNSELLEVLKELTNTQKKIIYYIYVKNFTIKETADLLGLSRQSVYKTYNLALSKIKKKLGV